MAFINERKQTRPMESQTERGMFDVVPERAVFIDLRPLEDDKTVLKNPHKGWFWHYIDNGFRAGAYRDRNLSEDFIDTFPAMNHLYLRFDWADVEKEEGVYDFGFLDEIMDRWSKRGYTFSLRACAYESSPAMEFATPRYVFEKGAVCYRPEGRSIQPDYGDPYFLERLELFMAELGKKYNSDPRVELIDVGTYGTWGEGHTVEGDGVIYPLETVKKHFLLHLKYFPDKFVVANDDHIIGRMVHGQEEVEDMLRFCESHGLGLQDDSICCDGYATDMGYDTMRAPWAFQRLAKYAPSVIEFAHYTYVRPYYDCYYRDGFTIIEALKNSKATFAGFHGYPDSWLKNERYLTEYCANRLGYWLFVPYAVATSKAYATAHNALTLCFENRGWARPYWKFDIKVCVSGNGFKKIIPVEGDLRRLESGEKQEFTVDLDLRDLPKGEYEVCAGVFEGEKPVKLAIKESALREGGFYKITNLAVEEPVI
ncbi:MAG: DUF4832 domain-containing protein [Clostridia bacterium]|nr:DUF4832 domain-containing protein [Clostridia bacterium]